MINLQKRKNIGIFGLIGLLVVILFISGVIKTFDNPDKDIIHRGNSIEPQSIDPHLSQTLNEANIQRDIFEGLTAEAANGTIIPGVALRWETSKDQLRWTFFLRKDAKWSNGDTVVAKDFVNAFKRVADPKTGAPFAAFLKPIVNADKILKGEEKDLSKLGIREIDEHTLEIELVSPIHHLLTILAHHTTYPFHEKTYEQHKAKWTTPSNIVCNGPYKLSEHIPQSHIKLIKNDQYWDKKNVKTSTIMYYPTEDSHAELKKFINSEIHTTETIPQDQIEWVEQNMKGSFRKTPYPGVVFYGFNMTSEPFKSNEKLRQALALSIDRTILTEKIAKLGATPAYSWIPKGMGSYKPQEVFFSSMTQDEREKKAKELFMESGLSPENPPKIEILLKNNNSEKSLAVAISGMWKKVLNIETTLHEEEWKVYANNRSEKKFQIIHLDGVADFPNSGALLGLFVSNQNTVGYSNPEFDILIEQALSAQSIEEQDKAFEKAETLFLVDLPVIPLYHSTKRHLVNTDVQGWIDNFMDVHPSRYLFIAN